MIQEYNKQVESLAKEFGCRIDMRPNLFGMMYVELGYIEVPTIENQIHYITGLHELSHFANGHTQGRPPHQDKRFYFDNGVLRSEADAWRGALDWCLDEVQEATRRFMWDFCLGSYYMHAIECGQKPTRLMNGNRHHVEFVYDKPDAYFTSIVKRIQGDLTDYKIKYEG
jgi:hypothetical protein